MKDAMAKVPPNDQTIVGTIDRLISPGGLTVLDFLFLYQACSSSMCNRRRLGLDHVGPHKFRRNQQPRRSLVPHRTSGTCSTPCIIEIQAGGPCTTPQEG